MEFKLYQCSRCGNIAYKLHDSGVPMVCCGEPMDEMKVATSDGAYEKHVPVIEKAGNEITIKVGSVPHPMVEEHYIPFIVAVNEDTVAIKKLQPGAEPLFKTTLEGKVTAYEWCNLHGLWKGE